MTTQFLASQEEPEQWYRNGSGGKPTTEEEKAFILDFIARNGRAPFLEEAADWRGSQDPSTLHYTPESPMGQLGWSGMDQETAVQRQNRYGPYGPGQGDLVPENAILFSDAEQNPYFRSPMLGNDMLQGFIRKGQYFTPPEGLQWENGQMAENGLIPFIGPDSSYRRTQPLYPEYNPPDKFVQPSFSDTEMTYERYLAQMDDYLQQTLKEDYQAVEQNYNEIDTVQSNYETFIDDLNTQVQNGTLSEKEAQEAADGAERAAIDEMQQWLEALNGLMTFDKANELRARAQSQADLQLPFEQLVNFGEVQDAWGPNTANWYDQYVNTQRGQAEQRSSEYEQQFNDQYSQARQDYQNRNWYPPSNTYEPTGKERDEWQVYVQSLQNLAPPFRKWMIDEFWNLFPEWQAGKRDMPFVEWARQRLIGG